MMLVGFTLNLKADDKKPTLEDKVMDGIAEWTVTRDQVRSKRHVVLAYIQGCEYLDGIATPEQQTYYVMQMHDRPKFHYWGACSRPEITSFPGMEKWAEVFKINGKFYGTSSQADRPEEHDSEQQNYEDFCRTFGGLGGSEFIDVIASPSDFEVDGWDVRSHKIEKRMLNLFKLEDVKEGLGGELISTWRFSHPKLSHLNSTLTLIQSKKWNLLPRKLKIQFESRVSRFFQATLDWRKSDGLWVPYRIQFASVGTTTDAKDRTYQHDVHLTYRFDIPAESFKPRPDIRKVIGEVFEIRTQQPLEFPRFVPGDPIELPEDFYLESNAAKGGKDD